MQKKIKKSLAVILSILMIMTIIPFTPVAVATDGADPITEKDCTEHADTDGNEFCDVCGELINAKVITADSDGMVYVDGEALEITGYYNNDLILPAGNYKLTGDVTSAYYISSREGEVTLDLNGYVWDMKDCYLLLSHQFSLYDTSDAGTGKLTSSWIETVYIGKTDTQFGTFNLYSGTVENTSTLTDSYIISASYGDANLYGGKIKGNAYAFFNYMFSDLTINLDGTVIENGEGYAQVKSDLVNSETPKTVIDVTDYTGESFTVDAEIDEEGKIKIFEGIKSAQEAENYQINFLTKYGEVYCEKIEYDEATGEKYIYVAKNAFTQQPYEKNNYTVEFNNPDASFRWYEVNENEIGKYTTEEGDHLYPYDFKKGDILKVTTTSEIEYAVIEAGSYRLRLDKENKTATVRIDEDEKIEIFTRFVDPDNDVELNFSVIKETALEGETGKTLQNPKYEKSYWCKATVGTKVYPSDIAFICYAHDYDENGKCYSCKMQAAAKVTDKDGNKLSDSPYETFAEAVTAASASEGSTLTLLDDVTLTKEQDIRSGKFTLDLNGKNLINVTGRVLYIYEEVDLTIKDSGETGTLESMNDGSSVIWNYGTLTVESGIIKGAGGIDNKGTLTFKDGTVEVVTYSAIYNTGTAYVYDGVLKHAKSHAIGNYGTLYVYDGEIDGIINDCDAYISGGEIDCDNYAALNLLGGKLEVTGGSFTGTDLSSGYYSGTPYGEWTVYFGEDATLTLKGGEFPNGFAVANTTANTSLAEGYAFYDKDGNKITVADDSKKIEGYVRVKEHFIASVTDKDGNELEGSPYKTFAEAITAASASEDSTLTLLDDITLTETARISSGKFILDLNGKTILNKTDNVLLVYYDANITIKDSCEGGTVETGGDYCYGISNLAELTVESGTVKGSGSGISNHGTLTVYGGNFESYTYGAITNKATAKIYGGVFEGTDRGEGIQNDASGEIYIYGGKISGNTALLNTGTAYISGGEFTGNDYAALNILKGTVEVTGGSFTGTDFSDGYFSGTPYGEWTVDFDSGATFILKGGEFPNGFVTDETTENAFLAEGYHFRDAEGKIIEVAEDTSVINGYAKVSNGADLSEAVITLDVTEFTYSGQENKPTVIVTVGGKVLTEGTDYTVSYANNVNAGTATVTITAVADGNYSGQATTDFTIAKKPVTVTATAPDKVYDGTTDILEYSKVIVEINGAVEGEVLGFTVEKAWYDSADAGTDKVVHIIYAPVASDNLDNYEFPMNPEYSTDNCYIEATASITPKSIHDGFIILGDALTYNGTEQTQIVEKVLPTGTVPEATFTVSGNKATNVGVYLLTVTGTGNFTGEAKIAYEIAVDMNGIDAITVENVTSADKAAIEAVKEQISNAVTDIADDETKAEYKAIADKCDELLAVINDTADEIARTETAVNGYDKETVKSTDSDELAQIKEDIQSLIDSGHVTENEKAALEDMIADIEGLEDKITETNEKLEEIKSIESDYNPESVSSDDKAAIEEKIAEIEAVNLDNLTPEQKAEYDEIKAGFEALLEEIAVMEKAVADIGAELEMFDENRVTKFWEDDIEALKAKIDELLAEDNLGEAEKTKLNEYKAKCDNLIDIINTPAKYFSFRFFWLISDFFSWIWNIIIRLF